MLSFANFCIINISCEWQAAGPQEIIETRGDISVLFY